MPEMVLARRHRHTVWGWVLDVLNVCERFAACPGMCRAPSVHVSPPLTRHRRSPIRPPLLRCLMGRPSCGFPGPERTLHCDFLRRRLNT
jgi:hypothetical protein